MKPRPRLVAVKSGGRLVWRRNERVRGETVSADYASFRSAMLATEADIIRRALRHRGLRHVKRLPGAKKKRSA